MEYLHWQEKTITDFSDKNISEMYDKGFVFTRIGKGVMHQTRSVRIDLSKFTLSSENRRVLKKVCPGAIEIMKLEPIPFKEYDWSIGKMAKDFYEKKFGPGIMSVQKIKEMLTDIKKSNFNYIARYIVEEKTDRGTNNLGYTICYQNDKILHYSYPFYDLENSPKDMGLGMMTMAVELSKDSGLKYVYLGSLQRPTDTYKLQFSGLEWFDGSTWKTDLEEAKNILRQT